MRFKDYAAADRTMNTADLVFSLTATLFGASAVFGTMSYVFAEGEAYIWFLWISSFALFVKGAFFAEAMHGTDAKTLPEAFGKVVHPALRKPAALLIAVSWTGIIAAQLIAVGSLIKAFFPSLPYEAVLTAFTLMIALYTALGGQKAVFATDKLQFLIMVICFVVMAYFLRTPDFAVDSRGIAGSSGLMLAWFVSKGLSVVVGPDMFTRISSAKNPSTAKRACFIAGAVHLAVSMLVLMLGVLLKRHSVSGEDIFAVMLRVLPPELYIISAIGFLCALASSCDTTLINAALILENDILEGSSTFRTAFFVFLMGGISLLMAVRTPDILKLIMTAYALYAPVCVPMFVTGLLFNRFNRAFHPILIRLIFAVGVAAAFLGLDNASSPLYITFFVFAGSLAATAVKERSIV